MLILVHGSDSFRSHDKVEQLKEKFKREVDPSGMNCVELEAENLETGTWSREISTTPFLARRRMIVGKRVLSLAGARNILTEEEKQWWEIAVSAEPTSPIVIFYEMTDIIEPKEKVFKGKKTVVATVPAKIIEDILKIATVINNLRLTGLTLKQWIKEYVSSRSGKIDEQAVSFLASINLDTWSIAQVLNVCLAYCWEPSGPTVITKEECFSRVPETSEETLFPLQDAFIDKKTAVCFKEYHSLQLAGVHELQILNMLERSLLQLLQVKSGTLPAKTHPFVVKKITTASGRWEISELHHKREQLLYTDALLKSSDLSSEALLLRLF